MRPLTASSLILGAVGLGLLLAGGRARAFGRAAGALAMIDGLGALFEWALGKDLRFGSHVFGRGVVEAGGLYPGMLSLDAATAFVLLGGALLLSHRGGRQFMRDGLAASAGTIAGVVALGYAFGATSLYGVPPFAMALPTAVAICLLSLGVLLEDPERGLLRMLVHGSFGGVAARRLVPLTIALPIVLGVLLLGFGPRDPKLGAALLVAALVVTFTVVVLRNAHALERIDLERMRTDQNLQRATDVISVVTDAALRQLSERALLVKLCERVKELFDTDTASILLADERQRELFVAASVGLQAGVEAKIRVPFGRGVAGRIFSSGASMMVQDLSKVDAVSPVLRENIRSMLGAPLVAPDGSVVGVIDVGTRRCREFTEAEQHLMVLTADRLGSAVTLARTQQALRASEEYLRAERARLATILTSAPHGIVFVDAIDRRVVSNDAAEKMTGYSSIDQRAGDFPANLLARPNGTPISRDEWPGERALRGESVTRVEVLVNRPDGTRIPVLMSATPVRGSGDRVTGAVLAFEDITVFKELERLRNEFASIVAHDLRNPISSILMNAGDPAAAGRRPGHDRGLHRRSGAHPQGGSTPGRHGEGSARRRADRFQPFEARSRAAALANHRRGDRGAGPTDAGRASPEGRDRGRARANPGGPPALRPDSHEPIGERREVLPPRCAHRRQGDVLGGRRGGVREGRGNGIGPQEIARLFDRFYQAKRAREMKAGLGLGLYIVHGLVAAHGGRIWVDSEPARGSTFHVWMPSAHASETQSAPREAPAAP